jgi:hypothetical protein
MKRLSLVGSSAGRSLVRNFCSVGSHSILCMSKCWTTATPDVSEGTTMHLTAPWIPADCWTLTKLWMECFDMLPELLHYKREKETERKCILSWEDVLKLVTQDPKQPLGVFTKMLTAPTGHKKNGDAFYGRPDHLLGPNKKRSELLANDEKCVPVDALKLSNPEEARETVRNTYVQMVVDETNTPGIESDDEDHAHQLPLVAPGQKSIAEPKPLARAPVHRDDSKSKRCLDPKGKRYESESPISEADRARMKDEEKEIEETLFHQKDHFDPAAIALRRAVCFLIAKQAETEVGSNSRTGSSENVVFTITGDEGTICRDLLLKDQGKLMQDPRNAGEWMLVKQDGYERRGGERAIFEVARACNKAAKGNWQKKGNLTWAMFEFAGEVDRNKFGGQEQPVMISRPVLNFVEKFNAEIRAQRPLASYSDVENFCKRREIIRPKSLDTDEDMSAPFQGESVCVRERGRVSVRVCARRVCVCMPLHNCTHVYVAVYADEIRLFSDNVRSKSNKRSLPDEASASGVNRRRLFSSPPAGGGAEAMASAADPVAAGSDEDRCRLCNTRAGKCTCGPLVWGMQSGY